MFINVGGNGESGNKSSGAGGYNGGGKGKYLYHAGLDPLPGPGGGGATHVALEPGLLNTFENKKEKILIVAGGGGGHNKNVYPGKKSGCFLSETIFFTMD